MEKLTIKGIYEDIIKREEEYLKLQKDAEGKGDLLEAHRCFGYGAALDYARTQLAGFLLENGKI